MSLMDPHSSSEGADAKSRLSPLTNSTSVASPYDPAKILEIAQGLMPDEIRSTLPQFPAMPCAFLMCASKLESKTTFVARIPHSENSETSAAAP